MFEQVFKNLDDVLRKEAGCASELDYAEQTSWLLFLKYLDHVDDRRKNEAALRGKKYTPLLDEQYRWDAWAAPKTKDGKIDHDRAMTGDDLLEFVNGDLFPHLAKFKGRTDDTNTIEYKIGQIFDEIRNRFQSGYNLRDALDHLDALNFKSQDAKHELSDLYESRIKNMGNAGRNGGEYYTPRPLIRAMVEVTDPQIGETVYDPACGSAGFLCEAYELMMSREKRGGKKLGTADLETLQSKTFYGIEKKSLAYILGIMNMILHGIDAPNIVHTNTLATLGPLAQVQDKDRHDIVLANPPFGGKERVEVQENFPIKTSETAFLFLQHFVKYLKAGGRGAIVIKNTFLSNQDNASRQLRKELLSVCDLHTILDCPGGVFQGAGVKTVVLFFEKGKPTQNVWYYQLDPGRNLGKTNPLTDDDLAEFVKFQKKKAKSAKSWSVPVADIDETSWDLSVRNPFREEEAPLREPAVILDEIAELDRESAEILAGIRGML